MSTTPEADPELSRVRALAATMRARIIADLNRLRGVNLAIKVLTGKNPDQ